VTARGDHRQLLALARSGRVVYGLNTGCGPLCDRPVPPDAAARFQRNLVRSHASGLGAAHPTEVVRATMAVRALSLAQGRSAVRPLVVETLVAMLNAGVLPVIPETGSVGASGTWSSWRTSRRRSWVKARSSGGARRPAAEARGVCGSSPSPSRAWALALMNGTACETAQAVLLSSARRRWCAAETAAARSGSPEAFDARPRGAAPGGTAGGGGAPVGTFAGSERLRDGAARTAGANGRLPAVQDAHTLRCVRVLGASARPSPTCVT
jgi:histidine ammonia-lyase